MRQTSKYAYQAGNPHNGDSVACKTSPKGRQGSCDLTPLLHRRAVEIHQRIRSIRAKLTTNGQRLVFDYIVDNTIGRNKDTDQIANSQFMSGKRCRKTGKVIDFGCGLRSINTIRKARKILVSTGIIFEEVVTDLTGANEANRYGLTFIRDLLSVLKPHVSCTRRGYQKETPTIKSPSEITTQRCRTTPNRTKTKRAKNKLPQNYYMHPDHVDYLIDLIEAATGDTHSRGAFAEIVLTVEEGTIMELLAVLRDRDNINNPGAWFLSAARNYQQRHIIKADSIEPRKNNDAIPNGVSLRDLLADRKPDLVELLDMNKTLSIQSVHNKFIVGK